MNPSISAIGILFILKVVHVSGQSCSSSCTCNDAITVCSNITSFPILPSGTENMTITDSPSFTAITSIPRSVTSLYIINTGLKSIASSTLESARQLQVLYLEKNAKLTEIDLGNPTQTPDLTTFYLSESEELLTVQNINKYEKLQRITISLCGLQEIDEDMFEDLEKVTYLDISRNRNLKKIDKDAFEELDALESLDISSCALNTLYPDYFDNAYHRNLNHVMAMNNPYMCLQMCDFMRWYWGHEDFYKYAYLGTCTIYSYGKYYFYGIFTINRYQAGCPTAVGVIVGATIGAFFFICIAACVFVVACGINYRKYCCFCCESQRNRNDANATNDTENNRTDQADDFIPVQYHASADKTQINSPYTFSAAPPSYEDITRELEREPVATVNMPEEPSNSTI